jgi:predicted phage terminase large subunit-like protein
LETNISNRSLNGDCFSCPLVDESGTIAWPGKYPDLAAIEEERKRVGNEGAWQREYLLRIIPDLDRVVQREWVQRYDNLPDECGSSYRGTATGVDLAISESASSDFTAMVSAKMFGEGNDLRIYVLPNPVNERIDFPTTLERIKLLSHMLGGGQKTDLYVESVGYQAAMIQQLVEDGYPAHGFQPHGQDKRARLTLTTNLIQNGTILFPKHGAEDLIEQIVEFGVARHDDLADAFAILILKITENLGQKFTFPGAIISEPITPALREEGERTADRDLIWRQESARAGFPLPRTDPPGQAFTF